MADTATFAGAMKTTYPAQKAARVAGAKRRKRKTGYLKKVAAQPVPTRPGARIAQVRR